MSSQSEKVIKDKDFSCLVASVLNYRNEWILCQRIHLDRVYYLFREKVEKIFSTPSTRSYTDLGGDAVTNIPNERVKLHKWQELIKNGNLERTLIFFSGAQNYSTLNSKSDYKPICPVRCIKCAEKKFCRQLYDITLHPFPNNTNQLKMATEIALLAIIKGGPWKTGVTSQ